MPDVSRATALEKIRHFCAYQERHHGEVRAKLDSLGVPSATREEIICQLIDEGFLNEERFARLYCGGKFRLKKWGRLKIVSELEAKGLSPTCIRLGLTEINADDYEQTLHGLLEEKWKSITEPDLYARRDKLSKTAIRKGFEPELVWRLIREMFPDDQR